MQTARLQILHRASIISFSHLRSEGLGLLKEKLIIVFSRARGWAPTILCDGISPIKIIPLLNNVAPAATFVCNHFSPSLHFSSQSFFSPLAKPHFSISRGGLESRGQSKKIIC